MNRLHIYLMVIIVMAVFASCGNKKKSETSVVEDPTAAVCIWDKVSLKEAPADNGKWLASINLGEKCTFLKDSKTDNSGKKPVTYIKLKLQDGTEGWAQNDFIVLESKAAAVIKESEIYSRPDLLTKTKKTFSIMDIVAVKSFQDSWIEVSGKRKNGKWVETGWINSSDVSYTPVDIAVANFASKALSISDKQKKKEAIKEIVENTAYASSLFISNLNDQVETTKIEEEPVAAPAESSESTVKD